MSCKENVEKIIDAKSEAAVDKYIDFISYALTYLEDLGLDTSDATFGIDPWSTMYPMYNMRFTVRFCGYEYLFNRVDKEKSPITYLYGKSEKELLSKRPDSFTYWVVSSYKVCPFKKRYRAAYCEVITPEHIQPVKDGLAGAVAVSPHASELTGVFEY